MRTGSVGGSKVQKAQCMKILEAEITNMNFLSLPPELLVAIVALLDVRDILSFCRICRFAHNLVTNSTTLQYLIAVFAAGVSDEGILSFLSTRDRLAYLSRREDSWKVLHLRAERRVAIPVFHRHSHIHDLNAGVYVFGELSAFPDSIRVNSLRFVHLPTCTHDIDNSKSATSRRVSLWSYIPLGVEALSIGVSLEYNDLLAILTSAPLSNAEDTHTFRLHLKNFSTGTYHTLAQQPIIQFHEHQNEGNQCIASIDIAGQYLLVLLTWLRAPNMDDELFVYDWMTASLIKHLSSRSFTYRGAAFLSLDTFILTNMRDNTIEFLRLSQDEDEVASVKCRWIGRLALPALQRGSSLISMNCRTDAVRSQNPRLDKLKRERQPSEGTSRRSVAPVRCAPDKSIVQFRMYLQGGGTQNVGHVSLFAFIVHRGELLQIVESNHPGPGSTSPSEVAATPWDSWGPGVSRWSGSDETDTAWMAGVAGQRQIFITGDRARRIHVRDYNSASVRKELSRAEDGDRQSRITVFSEESVIAHQGCFAHDIRSSLPFVEVTSEQTYEYDGVLMDECHVVGLTEDEEDGSIRQLDVFIMTPDVPRTCKCTDASTAGGN